MSRFKTYGSEIEPPLWGGDPGFLGVNQVDKPSLVGQGELCDARNARFTTGQAEPRRGMVKCGWTNRVFSWTVLIQPFGTIYGAGVFKDPTDVEWLIVAADGKAYRTREGAGAVELKIPVGDEILSPVTLVQTYNGMVMFRGSALEPLYMKDLDAGFVPVSEETTSILGTGTENPTEGSKPIPNADNGEWVGNRLFIPHSTPTEKDLLGISDYLNATRLKPIMSQARINQGSSDRLLRFFKFSETAGVAFKEQSIHALYNIKGDLSTMVQDEITAEFGLAAPYSVVHAGRDADENPSMLWFLSEKRGVCAIVAGEFGKLQVAAVPISRKIQQLIARIDWANASLARAAWWDNKVYLAVPLDDAHAYAPVTLPATTYASPTLAVPVIYGQRYRWEPGASETQLANGTDTHTGPAIFTAQSWKVEVSGTVGQAVTASLELEFSDTNNAVLVYDFIAGAWSGRDDSAALCVKEFVKTVYNGARRLFFLGADGFINLVEDGFEDETAAVVMEDLAALVSFLNYDATGRREVAVQPGQKFSYGLGADDTGILNGTETLTAAVGSFTAQGNYITLLGTPSTAVTLNFYWVSWQIQNEPIQFEVLTRGYTCEAGYRKQFRGARLQLETWMPTYSVAVKLDGVKEEFDVKTDITKSRTRYSKPFGPLAWDETNINDDHATPYREDYSIILGDHTIGTLVAPFGRRYFVDNLTGQAGIVYASQYYAPGATFLSLPAYTGFSTSLTDSLVAQWLLEEASGNRDDAKGASNLVPINAPGRAAGKVGYATSFTLDTQHLQCATNTDLEMGDIDFTICGWWYFDGVVADFARLMCGKGWLGDASNEYSLGASSSPQNIRFIVHAGASEGIADSGIVPVTGHWYFVCAWHDSVNNKVGIHVKSPPADGNVDVTVETAHTAGVPVGAREFTVGNAGVAQPFKGKVDALAIWKRVLTSSERAALYNSGAGVEFGLGGTPAVYQPGDYLFLGVNGVDPELHQELTEQIMMMPEFRGQFLQLRLSNTLGRCALLSSQVDAQRGEQRIGSHV